MLIPLQSWLSTLARSSLHLALSTIVAVEFAYDDDEEPAA